MVERELEATIAARRELGPEHDDHLISGFLERIDHEIERRVDERFAKRRPRRQPLGRREFRTAIPIIAVAGIFGGPAGVFIAFAALLIAFLVLSVTRR